MRKNIISIVALVALATTASASINFTGSAITNIGGAGTTWAPSTLTVFVLDTNNDGFAGASAASLNAGQSVANGAAFGSADDIVMFSSQVLGGGTTAVVNGSVFEFPAGGSVGDNWGIFVFDANNFGDAALTAGTYGFFTSQGGSGDWDLPADGTTFSFSGTPGTGQFQQLSGVTGSSLTVVPEPSAFAALAGVLALGFVAVRRRRA